MMEDELIPVFERIGKLYLFRLMMDFSGTNRGYAFATFTNKQDAKKAVAELDGFEIRPRHPIGVVISVDNCRLYIGKIPRHKTSEEVRDEICKLTEGVVKVILYPNADDRTKNRGFAFVEYKSHQAATVARRKLLPGQTMWGVNVEVDWAEPELEPDEEVIAKAKNLYVRNLPATVEEGHLRELFEKITGRCSIEHVKKLKDYAFVHFFKREDAMQAMQEANGTEVHGAIIEVVWAKPVDKNLRRLKSTVLQMTTPSSNSSQVGLQGYVPILPASPFMATAPHQLLLATPPGHFGLAPTSAPTWVKLAGSPEAMPYAGMPFIDPSAGNNNVSNGHSPRNKTGAGMRSAGTQSFVSNQSRRTGRQKLEINDATAASLIFNNCEPPPNLPNGYATGPPAMFFMPSPQVSQMPFSTATPHFGAQQAHQFLA